MQLWPFSKSKLNLKSDCVNLLALSSPIECLLYLPNVRAIQYKLGPERLTRLGNSNVPRLPVYVSSRFRSSNLKSIGFWSRNNGHCTSCHYFLSIYFTWTDWMGAWFSWRMVSGLVVFPAFYQKIYNWNSKWTLSNHIIPLVQKSICNWIQS